MLIVKEPIRLQSAANMISVQNGFGERIRDNYSLLSTQFTPKELLFLLSGTPEAPEEQGGMTTLVTQNSLSVQNGMTVELFTQIVNRILLTQHTPFTYQDSVYITTMLRRVGITDVWQFMRQVRQLSEQSAHISSLSALYQAYHSTLRQAAPQNSPRANAPAADAAQDEQPSARERYFLHSAIYRRLQTAAVYREVSALLTSTSSASHVVEMRELALAEQYRVSELLRLAELRQQTVDRGQSMTLQHVCNHYERGDLLPAPEDEEQVFAQLAAAVLLNTVDKAMTLAVRRSVQHSDFWLDLRQAVQQSIDNTVFRFESWHEGARRYDGDTLLADESRNSLYRQEYALLRQLIKRTDKRQSTAVQRGGDEIVRQTMNALSLTLGQTGDERPEAETPPAHLAETLRALLAIERMEDAPVQVLHRTAGQFAQRLAVLTGSLSTGSGAHPATEAPQDVSLLLLHDSAQTETELLRAEFDRLDETTRTMLERSYQQKRRELLEHSDTVSAEDMQRILTETLHTAATRQTAREQTEQRHDVERSSLLDRKTREVLERMRSLRVVYGSEHTAEHSSEQTLYHSEQTVTQEQREERQVRQVDTQTLREQLDLIDRHNREMLERVQRACIEQVQNQSTMIRRGDTRRVIDDALRAMDEPEQMLRDVLARPEEKRDALVLSPDARTLLQQADEPTRRMLEAVMRYQADPTVEAATILHTVSPGAFNMDTASAREKAAASSGHPPRGQDAPQDALIHGAAREVMHHASVRRAGDAAEQGMARTPPPVQLTHKTAVSAVSEELIEQMEQRRETLRRIEQTQSTEQHERVDRREIDQTVHQTIERTGEDVTELIQRTLARQLGAISDKVYSQMEKRLRLERARRGR
ncbi:MAG: hypothetical protein MR935_03040 [Agathobaculum sp.]|uniref:hypothetical protein n=3 Tax=Agathobaculum sp. TaxID=2048138 RepID=UPI0025BA5188|nr:hypothetical protein [Agathobaculum sp.]MCI7125168.1 hypothetical protein [Agathobaculum sp.]